MNATTKSAMEEYGDYLFKGSIILFIAFTPIYIALTEVMFWLILVGYVVHKVGVGKPLLRTTGVGIAMLAFVAALVFTSFFSIKPLHSLAAIGAFRFFLLYIMLANYEMQEDFASHLANLILYMAVVWSGVEIIKYFRANALRLDVFTAHINTLVIPMVVGPLIMVEMGRIKRGIFVLFLCILLTASFLSLSRAAWLGTLAGITVLLFYWNWKILLPLGLLVIIMAFFVALYCPHSPAGKVINSTVKPFQPEGERTGSNQERLQMLKDTVAIVKKDPFTGIGHDAYKYVSTDKHIRISMDHVQALATTGLIGFAAYGWLLFTLLRRCFQNEKAGRASTPYDPLHVLYICFFAAFIGFLVCGSFEPNFFSSKRLRFMMLMLGLNECLFRAASKETNESTGKRPVPPRV
ncbi:MAG: O-antigen ligase family protein [Planctomycetota bacterium]